MWSCAEKWRRKNLKVSPFFIVTLTLCLRCPKSTTIFSFFERIRAATFSHAADPCRFRPWSRSIPPAYWKGATNAATQNLAILPRCWSVRNSWSTPSRLATAARWAKWNFSVALASEKRASIQIEECSRDRWKTSTPWRTNFGRTRGPSASRRTNWQIASNAPETCHQGRTKVTSFLLARCSVFFERSFVFLVVLEILMRGRRFTNACSSHIVKQKRRRTTSCINLVKTVLRRTHNTREYYRPRLTPPLRTAVLFLSTFFVSCSFPKNRERLKKKRHSSCILVPLPLVV